MGDGEKTTGEKEGEGSGGRVLKVKALCRQRDDQAAPGAGIVQGGGGGIGEEIVVTHSCLLCTLGQPGHPYW